MNDMKETDLRDDPEKEVTPDFCDDLESTVVGPDDLENGVIELNTLDSGLPAPVDTAPLGSWVPAPPGSKETDPLVATETSILPAKR